MSAAETGAGSGAAAGGNDLALDAATASSVAGCHDSAAGQITGLASSVPNINSGYATWF